MSNEDKRYIYKEIIPFGRFYNFVMLGEILLLGGLAFIFIFVKIWQGALSSILILLFITFIAMKLRDVKLFITDREFIWKWWFLTFKTNISDIESVEIKDVDLIPQPYRGHIKIYWGLILYKELKGFKLRKGEAVHIKTKKGQTIIVTAQDNEKLAEILKQQKEVL